MPSFFHNRRESSPEPLPDGGNSSGPSISPNIVASEATEGEDPAVAQKLDGAFTSINTSSQGFHKYEDSRSRRIADGSGGTLDAIQTNVASAQNYSSTMKTVYDSESMKFVRDGVNALVDSLPGLVKALDEVAKLHPFIAVAVGAFRVVVELDIKRRDNDKKIAVLFVEMKDMMEALLQLRSIKDADTAGPDGLTIKARMQELVKKAADDIKSCANACDTYSKKKLIVKVIKGSVWDSTLKSFIDIFARQRKAFTFALSIHIGVGVDDANRQLKVIDEKIDLVIEFFTKFVSPEQQELGALIAKKGGATAVMGNNEALNELLLFKPGPVGNSGKRADRDGTEHSGHGERDELSIVKEDLFDSPELAIRKNLEVFERKFKMQQRELAEEVRRMVHHEGDRVIEAFTSGPHERIIDPDIHEIWKEMRWPGHVKARHFVLALRDYYRQQLESKNRKVHDEEKTSRLDKQDEWAIEYINLSRLQAVAEAFDDDASGFITIAEVNHFTSTRPKDWSLIHWLAYWAIGWQMTATYYRQKIVEICAKMFALRPHIHPANRNAVNKYLSNVWKKVATLTDSLVRWSWSDEQKGRFISYVDAEEQRLREGLETFKYDIDAMDTLTLITGPGRIEKYVFPLMYLLLSRDFEIIRVCQSKVIHKDELWDSADTMLYVFDAVQDRYNDLKAIFKQQGMDASQQFKNFASELFDYWHDGTKIWNLSKLRDVKFLEVEYDDSKEDQNVDVDKLLNYPSAADDLYTTVHDTVTEIDAQADDAVRMILGRWYGFLGAERWPAGCMTTFCFHASTDKTTYETSGVAAHGTGFTILGQYTTNDEGQVEYRFSRTYAARLGQTYLRGTLDEDGTTLSGSWGYSEDKMPYEFWFKRTEPEILVARPPPAEFKANRIRALWDYALTYARSRAQRTLWSWSYFKQRRDKRHEYLELLEREADGLQPDEDLDRFAYLERTSTYDDIRWFYVLQDYRQRPKPIHFGIVCDHCDNHIYGTRMVCMQCGSRGTFDFCDKPECVSAVVSSRDDNESPHLPTHDFVKIRTDILHYREIGKVLRSAEAGLAHANKLLKRALRCGSAEQSHDDQEKQPKGARPSSARRDSSDSDSDADVPVLTCISCSVSISHPCWYCIDCPEKANVFVCQTCDQEKGGITHGDTHLATHNLVRCMDNKDGDEEKGCTESRIAALETQMSALTAQIEKLLQSLASGRPNAIVS
ncbi:hypothetical protein C8Q74DRAFT_1203793 [Fomes fomentarius]|nr:hypothetical protein C8Q74DRAFT_1203793 [Fomes fomentarius]